LYSALRRRRVDEHAVVAADDLVQRIAHGAQEVLVGGDDRAVELELDHRLRAIDGGDGRLKVREALRPPFDQDVWRKKRHRELPRGKVAPIFTARETCVGGLKRR
jgi:hypothetical protein